MMPARATELTVRPVVTALTGWGTRLVYVAELRMVAGFTPVGRALLNERCQRLLRKALLTFESGPGFGPDWWEIELSKMEAAVAEGSDDEAPAATGVRVTWTKLGAPLIEFIDEQDRVFAVAEFEPEGFSKLIGECCDVLEVVSKAGLATVVCKGAA